MSQNANNEASNPPWAEELTRLVERAQKGNQAVLPRLQTLLDAHPEVWEEHGELGRKTKGLLIHLITGKNLMAAVSLQRKLEAMRKELLEGSSSPWNGCWWSGSWRPGCRPSSLMLCAAGHRHEQPAGEACPATARCRPASLPRGRQDAGQAGVKGATLGPCGWEGWSGELTAHGRMPYAGPRSLCWMEPAIVGRCHHPIYQ